MIHLKIIAWIGFQFFNRFPPSYKYFFQSSVCASFLKENLEDIRKNILQIKYQNSKLLQEMSQH